MRALLALRKSSKSVVGLGLPDACLLFPGMRSLGAPSAPSAVAHVPGPSPASTLPQKCIECVQPSDPARTMIEVGCGAHHPTDSRNQGCGS